MSGLINLFKNQRLMSLWAMQNHTHEEEENATAIKQHVAKHV